MRKRRGISTKALVALLALVLVIGCSLGGTLAWLTDKTDAVTNTFTVGDINITLTETERKYKILPGVDIPKDPKVTVEANSEACWLFVKVDEVNWPPFTEEDGALKVNYGIADGWKRLDEENHPGVYYREVDAATAEKGAAYGVLLNNEVTVSENLTKTEVNSITTKPQLTFTAYAVQKEGVNTAAEAWKIANPATP